MIRSQHDRALGEENKNLNSALIKTVLWGNITVLQGWRRKTDKRATIICFTASYRQPSSKSPGFTRASVRREMHCKATSRCDIRPPRPGLNLQTWAFLSLYVCYCLYSVVGPGRPPADLPSGKTGTSGASDIKQFIIQKDAFSYQYHSNEPSTSNIS